MEKNVPIFINKVGNGYVLSKKADGVNNDDLFVFQEKGTAVSDATPMQTLLQFIQDHFD